MSGILTVEIEAGNGVHTLQHESDLTWIRPIRPALAEAWAAIPRTPTVWPKMVKFDIAALEAAVVG